MKHLFTVVGSVCLIAMLLPACAPAPEPEAAVKDAPNIEADTDALKAYIEMWDEALNNGDVDGLVSFYADDAVRMEADNPAWVGKNAIKAGFENSLSQMDAIEVKNSLEDVVISGDWTIARISWSATVTFKSVGEPTNTSGAAVSLRKRQPDGTWKTVWDIWNRDAPLPAAPTN
jgi:uncharacterized protein (TIGR02246 family)